MLALTICQPYAWLFTLPQSDPRHKRTENRPIAWSHRGPLAIHAGKSRDWMKTYDGPMSADEINNLVYGAVIAICNVVEGGPLSKFKELPDSHAYGWVKFHRHAVGPCVLVFDYIQTLPHPIPCQGAQGLWKWEEPAGIWEPGARDE